MNKEELLKAIEQKRQEIRPTNTGEMKPVTVPNNLELGWLNALKWMEDLINSLPVEQSTEQLCWNDMTEEEKSNFFFDLSHQKQIEQPSENLEEAAQNYAKEMYGENWMDFEYTQDAAFRAMFHFKFGANWYKEQMMKSAIDGEVTKDFYQNLVVRGELPPNKNHDFCFGDKVKIIVVRKDEQ